MRIQSLDSSAISLIIPLMPLCIRSQRLSIRVRVRELRLTLGCGQLMLKYKIVLKQIERIAERLGVYATAGTTL